MSISPSGGATDIREYLYVDTPRVRTLLTQFAAGLPEGRHSERTRNWSSSLSAIEGLSHVEGSKEQEYRSLADLHVAMLEEDAEALKRLTDVTEISQKKKNWLRGRLHGALPLGSLIRITAPTQVIDPSSFSSAVSAFEELNEDKSFFDEVNTLTAAMYGNNLALRVYPCGEEEWECQFSGLIADAGGYLEGERSTLFSRLGADSQEWTTVASVTRFSTQHTTAPLTRFQSVAESFQSTFSDLDNFNRRALESLIQETNRAMEGMGLTEAPTWPGIAVLPLAIYRKIPAAVISADLKSEN